MLDITTTTPAVETHRISLSLPTGETGAPLDHNASSLPLGIPDDSAAGVSSSVFVPERGRIKDLNVRLPGTVAVPAIEHDFLGDVVIDLIGPDGTSVRLAEHPGGPDNFGKDFVDVTFDDQASLRLGAPNDPVSAQRPSYSGTFKPQNDQLSRFDGKSRRGTWTLRVRDLFESDTGTLRAWGLTSRKAVCDFDATPPDTSLVSTPSDPTYETAPIFAFTSSDPGATFECRLDSGAYEPCSSPKGYSGLPPGSHTFSVRAIDGSDNEDSSPAQYTWTIDPPTDVVPPIVTITSPANGSSTADATPTFTGLGGCGAWRRRHRDGEALERDTRCRAARADARGGARRDQRSVVGRLGPARRRRPHDPRRARRLGPSDRERRPERARGFHCEPAPSRRHRNRLTWPRASRSRRPRCACPMRSPGATSCWRRVRRLAR